MGYKKKLWPEKLADNKGLPRVERITEKMSRRWGIGTIVIPVPTEVDEIMKQAPKGKLITINEIRSTLAKKHGATIGCPITTGSGLFQYLISSSDWLRPATVSF